VSCFNDPVFIFALMISTEARKAEFIGIEQLLKSGKLEDILASAELYAKTREFYEEKLAPLSPETVKKLKEVEKKVSALEKIKKKVEEIGSAIKERVIK